MSRKDELVKLARLFQAQAESCSHGPVKQILRKFAECYRREAKQLLETQRRESAKHKKSDQAA
jgi:hypothetical protein